jgi:hypothetical protein
VVDSERSVSLFFGSPKENHALMLIVEAWKEKNSISCRMNSYSEPAYSVRARAGVEKDIRQFVERLSVI